MRQRWFALFLLVSVAVVLLTGCTTRATTAPQTSEPAGPPAPTPGVAPTAPEVVPTAPAGTAGPTQEPPPGLASPQLTVQGTLEGGVQWGTTSDGQYFKGDPEAPLLMFEFSDFQ